MPQMGSTRIRKLLIADGSDIPLSTLQRLLEKHRFQHALCNPHPFPRRGQGMANPGGLSGRVLLCILTGPALLSQGAHETIE
jgi:hypothetical protein